VAGSPARRRAGVAVAAIAGGLAISATPAAAARHDAFAPRDRLAAAAAKPRDPFALTPRRAHLAQVVYPTAVRTRPGARRRRGRLATEARWGGGPVRLLVLRSALDRRGRRWLRVRLPKRPNDRAGWILADHTRTRTTPWRIVVSTATRTVTVRRAGRRVRRFAAVVGAPGTPTPHGLFAIGERIRQYGGVLGPWALHLTAHSRVLENYGGGKGRVAIHGRAGPLLADPLGTARSHGCVRLHNDSLSWLARRAIEGTPVVIR
jgi:lipoprotein-anchoring transpeptidase ErfK/SrfK